MRMAGGGEGRRKKRSVGADPDGEAQLVRVMTGGGEDRRAPKPAVLDPPDCGFSQHASRQMDAVCTDPARERCVAGDKKQYAPRPANRRVAAGDSDAFRIVIVAVNHGGSLGERAHNRLRTCDAFAVRQEGKRKWRSRSPALTFERRRRGC